MDYKRIFIFLSIIAVLLLSGCGSKGDESEELEESGLSVTEVNKEEENKEVEKEKKIKKKEEEPLRIEVTNKGTRLKNKSKRVYSDAITLDFKITNNTNRKIKGATFVIVVKDIFDEELMKLRYRESELNIPPRITFEKSGQWKINEFINTNVIAYQESFDNLRFEYILGTIIYDSGETEVINEF